MKNVDYEIWQDGICVVCVTGPDDHARREILHYALQYMQDGAIEIRGPNARAVFDALTGKSTSTHDNGSAVE